MPQEPQPQQPVPNKTQTFNLESSLTYEDSSVLHHLRQCMAERDNGRSKEEGLDLSPAWSSKDQAQPGGTGLAEGGHWQLS